MSDDIPVALRQAIRERAGFQCEYCLLPEAEAFSPSSRIMSSPSSMVG